MKAIHFIYNGKKVDFQPTNANDLMVNATQMAKIFGKRVDVFLKVDHVNEFINALKLTPFGGRSTPLLEEEILQTVNGVGTWMHRILALKFAAWLDPFFEVWVFTTVDKILLGHFKELKEATTEKLRKKQLVELKRKELLEKYPEFEEYERLNNEMNNANKQRVRALREATNHIQLELFATTS